MHQLEEVFLSLHAWRQSVTLPAWAAFSDISIMYAIQSMPIRALLVAGQFAVFFLVIYALRRHDTGTRVALSALLVVLSAAFTLHIALSVATHTFMPGVFTSVFPGLPGAVWLLVRTWRAPPITS